MQVSSVNMAMPCIILRNADLKEIKISHCGHRCDLHLLYFLDNYLMFELDIFTFCTYINTCCVNFISQHILHLMKT